MSHQAPPITTKTARIVRIAAPALSAVVIGFDRVLGSLLLVEPAFGSGFEVAPVRRVRGSMLGEIKLAPMIESALI